MTREIPCHGPGVIVRSADTCLPVWRSVSASLDEKRALSWVDGEQAVLRADDGQALATLDSADGALRV